LVLAAGVAAGAFFAGALRAGFVAAINNPLLNWSSTLVWVQAGNAVVPKYASYPQAYIKH
jgi:hypothetical protein